MNNIENNVASQTAEALARLSEALMRLERAAARRPQEVAPDVAMLRSEADDLLRRHTALKKSAGQVAARLDETIRRLAAVMEHEG